jgi:ribulose-bisphosphate carboxylase large chain
MSSTVANPVGLAAHLSGIRFSTDYLLLGDEAEALGKARDLCLEQTVEFPGDLLPPGAIPDSIVGRIESFSPAAPIGGAAAHRATVSYAVESAGGDLVQLLNVVFGNISILPGVRVEGLSLPPSVSGLFRGPRFGREGLRRLLGVGSRPLICTALKPMGLSATDLARQAYSFALGGLDFIKDDHGLADQAFCRFEDRVAACSEAVARANRETGGHCAYLPNVTAPAGEILARARRARELGAGGLLICPALTGLDAMRAVAEDDTIALPIMAHPSFGGSYVTSPGNGLSHGVLYGTLARLAGADMSVYPNYGGRFSFSRDECAEIARSTAAPIGGLAAAFPAPGGGMTTDRARDMLEVYGRDFVLLIGGGLHRGGPDLAENARFFVRMLESM